MDKMRSRTGPLRDDSLLFVFRHLTMLLVRI